MKQLTSWLLILCIVLQPVAQLALAEGYVTDHEGKEKAKAEFAERAEEESNEEGVHGSNAGGGEHFEFTDKDGGRHDLNIEHQFEIMNFGDRLTAVKESFGITTHDIPPPREARVASGSVPGAASDNTSETRQFNSDARSFHDYQAAVDRARPEPSKKDIPSRIELESEVVRLNAATQAGAAVSEALSAKLDRARAQFETLSVEVEPPELVVEEAPASEPLPPVQYNPQPARTNTIAGLEQAAHQAAASDPLDGISQAVNRGLITEIGSVLTPKFVRLGTFLKAHNQELLAGAELAVDIAVTAVPVASITWGLAQLASIAVRGTTVMGTPVHGAGGVALVALGAIAPAIPLGKIVRHLKEQPLVARGLGLITFKSGSSWALKAFERSPVETGRLAKVAAEVEHVVIETPYGPATQSFTREALEAKIKIEETREVYRVGTYGRSKTNPGMPDVLESPQHWATENPLSTADYAKKYGTDMAEMEFIEKGTVRAGETFVTRPAPPLGSNPGGGIEVVVRPGGVETAGHIPLPAGK